MPGGPPLSDDPEAARQFNRELNDVEGGIGKDKRLVPEPEAPRPSGSRSSAKAKQALRDASTARHANPKSVEKPVAKGKKKPKVAPAD